MPLSISDFKFSFQVKTATPWKRSLPFPPFLFAYCFSRNTLFINLLLLCRIMYFQHKTIFFSFNLLLVDFDFAVLAICVSWGAFSHFCCHEITFMNSFIFVYMHLYICIYASYLASHGIIKLKITGCGCFFGFRGN